MDGIGAALTAWFTCMVLAMLGLAKVLEFLHLMP